MNRWIAMILLVAILCTVFAGCGNGSQHDWHAGLQGDRVPPGQTDRPAEEGTTTGDTSPDDSQDPAIKDPGDVMETKPEDIVDPTEIEFTLNQVTEESYERLLAAGVLIGLSMNYPDFELEELCYKEDHSLSDKMESEGVYVFFRSGGESLCIYSRPLMEARSEKGVCDLQETTLGVASFDLISKDPSELDGYISLANTDLSEQINQLYLLTIIEN